MAASSLNLSDIVHGQDGGAAHWYIWPLFPLFVVYLVSGIAETNRHPFDVAEGGVGDRRGLPCRILGRHVRAVLPRRIT